MRVREAEAGGRSGIEQHHAGSVEHLTVNAAPKPQLPSPSEGDSTLAERGPAAPAKPERSGLQRAVVWSVGIASVVSGVFVLRALPSLPHGWLLQVAVFAAVTTIPHWFVELFARTAEALSTDLPSWAHVRGFRNIGAFVGLLERPLFLGALVAGYPQFIAVWFVFKGIAGYRVGLSKTQARRTFQLFLLNNAVSLAGVALGWLAWKLLGLPTY